MLLNKWMATAGGALVVGAVAVAAQQGGQQPAAPAAPDPVQILVDRLDLASYKATIKGLTQFGDRREGTQRNRDAVSWIEAQLKSYGCETERMTYEPPAARAGGSRTRRACSGTCRTPPRCCPSARRPSGATRGSPCRP